MHGTFERRKLEVFLACMTTGFGVWLLFPSEAMKSQALVHLAQMASEASWAGMFLAVGVWHGAWLAVNGSRWWSPIIRFWAAFGSASLYLMWCVGFATYDLISTGVYTYGMLALGSAWCCVFAWRDAVSAMRVHFAVTDHP
jgi:hypothetical protein